jgi:hypothetical protein
MLLCLLLGILITGSCTPIVIDETGNTSVGTIYINEIMAANNSTVVDPYYKNFTDWIELYNAGKEPIDLSDHFLTDNLNRKEKWPLPEGTVIGPGEYLVFWADGLDIYDHTNFKLDKEGEEVGLFNSVGVLVDHVIFDAQVADVSYGRKSGGDSSLYYFARPTPGAANTTTGVSQKTFAPAPRFSIPGGFYNGSRTVELSIEAGAQIKYTLDGSIPDEDSTAYTGPVQLDATAVLRARGFEKGALPGPVMTYTYFIDENITLPVVSVVTEPAFFFDEEIGVYVKGKDALPEVPYYGANFWEDWERPVNLEFFETGGTGVLNIQTGVKIYGGDSVGNEQKSLAFYAREKYGNEFIQYKFFANKDIDRFRRIVLRNSGQDWASTMFRDALNHSLIMGRMDIEYLSYRPAVLFINGVYWGIHNIREKMDEEYVEANYQLAPENIDLLYHFNGDIHASVGDKEHYNALLAFLEANDLTLPQNYDYIKTQMDMNEYLNYQVAQMYWVNTAWPSENTKLWRERVEGGKWRWMLYDTDFGFGLYHDYHKNMLEHSTATDGPYWPNPPWSTYLFRKLVEIPQFRDEFVQRFAAHMETTFTTERVLQFVEQIKTAMESEMTRNIARWGGKLDEMMGFYFPSSLAEWEANIDVIRQFAQRRPVYARQHLNDFFGLNGTVTLAIRVPVPAGGKVLVNGVTIHPGNFSGRFFKDIPLRLTVIPEKGFRFVKWEGLTAADQIKDSVSVILTKDTEINVVFVMMSYK